METIAALWAIRLSQDEASQKPGRGKRVIVASQFRAFERLGGVLQERSVGAQESMQYPECV
jgi:hypothetical protein